MPKYITEQLKRFNYLTSEIDSVYHEAAFRLGISDSVMQILYAICNKEGECPINFIVSMLGIKKQTVNSALRKLENENIVCLKPIDGKNKAVCFTEKGAEFALATVGRIIEIENEIFDSWIPDERADYLRLTQKYLTSLKEKVERL